MSKIVGLSGLIDRLNKLKNLDVDELVTRVAERGTELAQSKYSGEAVIVQAESLGNGKARIVASGDKVAFLEFGTGDEGAKKGYEGKLPTETITFNVGNRTLSTQGWEYYYDNAQTKRTKDGSRGWYYQKKFQIGQPAQAQMWRTANELEQEEIKKVVKQYLDEQGV